MIMWMIIRQAVIVFALSRLFKVFIIRPKILHPDRSNGLGPIGSYAMRATLLVVLLGFWLSAMIGYPLIWGEQVNPNFYFIAAFLLYIILVPVLLISPAWDAHLAMARAKTKELESIAVQIRDFLSTSGAQKTEITVTLEELQKRYQLMDQELHTWPFQVSALRRFILAASVVTPRSWTV
jgi:hypothetical protein